MNLDLRRTGRILMVVNFLLTAGVVVVGADYFAGAPASVTDGRVFRELRAPTTREEASKGPQDYASVSGTRFRTRGEGGGRRVAPEVKPGAASALQNTLRVLGIMLSNNPAFNCAVVEDIRTGQQYSVYEGDDVGPARVLAIRADEIEVLLYGQKTVLPLDLMARVREKGRSSGKGGKSQKPPGPSRSGNRGGNRDAGAPQGGAKPERPADKPAAPPAHAPAAPAAAPAGLKLSPELISMWQKLPADQRARWETWWNTKTPEEKAQWEKKLRDLAEARRNQG